MRGIRPKLAWFFLLAGLLILLCFSPWSTGLVKRFPLHHRFDVVAFDVGRANAYELQLIRQRTPGMDTQQPLSGCEFRFVLWEDDQIKSQFQALAPKPCAWGQSYVAYCLANFEAEPDREYQLAILPSVVAKETSGNMHYEIRLSHLALADAAYRSGRACWLAWPALSLAVILWLGPWIQRRLRFKPAPP